MLARNISGIAWLQWNLTKSDRNEMMVTQNSSKGSPHSWTNSFKSAKVLKSAKSSIRFQKQTQHLIFKTWNLRKTAWESTTNTKTLLQFVDPLQLLYKNTKTQIQKTNTKTLMWLVELTRPWWSQVVTNQLPPVPSIIIHRTQHSGLKQGYP